MTAETWSRYVKLLAQINRQGAAALSEWISKNGIEDEKALLNETTAIIDHYGKASGALACNMYELTAEAQGVLIQTAEMAELPTDHEIAKAVIGTKKHSTDEKAAANIAATVTRLIKQVAADTTLKNAKRDGAQFAWIPSGDTCAFCLTLASRGWQYMSKGAREGYHAEHIHANCDCQYAVRFDKKSTVPGYDPDKYLQMYNDAEGRTSREKINSMRRAAHEKDKATGKDSTG